MIAVESNILVYSTRPDVPWYERADQVLTELAEGRSPWAIPWPCIYEFIATVTHPRRYDPPTPMSLALVQVAGWLESPTLVLLSEPRDFFRHFEQLVRSSRVVGPMVHDARIASLCSYYGVEKLYTADRDFSRFANYLRIENPLVREA